MSSERQSRLIGTAWAVLVALATIAGISACGGSSRRSVSSRPATASSRAAAPATITLLEGTAPDSLDPQVASSTQAAEPDWLTYTGLLTYVHADGVAGTRLMPGLATSTPTITDGGRTYAVTLPSGLVYSDGEPVRASDFAWSVERAIKLHRSGAVSLLTALITGARAFAEGQAKKISGIQTDDASGQITIHLNSANGAFDNVLALPALGLVPSTTPITDQSSDPPPGVGPYMLTNVVGGVSYSLIKNPHWARLNLPGIPAGQLNVTVKVSSDAAANALSVLQNSADVLDWADPIPAGLITQVQSQASKRYRQRPISATDYIFMNTRAKPFSSQLVREAVVTGLDEITMSSLAGGALLPGCSFLPPDMTGYQSVPCPFGKPASGGDVTKSRQLIAQSGMAGARVTVWSEAGSPRYEWMAYYTSLLNEIGLDATQKVLPAGRYFSTIGTLKLGAQTGFDYWNANYPNPSDFFFQLQGSSILTVDNYNHSQVDDPFVNARAAELGAVPATNPDTVASQWQALNEYVMGKAYEAVFGYPTFPTLTSDRISQNYVFSPVYGWDWSSFRLK